MLLLGTKRKQRRLSLSIRLRAKSLKPTVLNTVRIIKLCLTVRLKKEMGYMFEQIEGIVQVISLDILAANCESRCRAGRVSGFGVGNWYTNNSACST
jgi:hypothetical protein